MTERARPGGEATERLSAAEGPSKPDREADEPTEPLNPSTPDDVHEEQGTTAEEAYERFLSERYPKVVGAARVIVRDHATAEDIAQEAFARAYLHWEKLWPEGNPGGWVHRVATNLAISWRRRAMRELKAVAKLGRRTPLTAPPPEAHPELHEAVSELPIRQRTAVALYYVLGLKVREVAEVMGCRPGTVKSLLFQARERLREELGDET